MRRHFVAAILIFSVAFAVYGAPDVYEKYSGLQAAPAELFANNSGDTLTIGAAPVFNRYVAVKGNPTAYARVDFSGSAGDTVIVYCNLWIKLANTWTYLGSYQVTATAGAVDLTTGSDNVGTNIAIFDTSAATYVEFRVAAPSAGTVDVTAWVGGADSGGR